MLCPVYLWRSVNGAMVLPLLITAVAAAGDPSLGPYRPTQVEWSSTGERLFVLEGETGTISNIDVARAAVVSRTAVDRVGLDPEAANYVSPPGLKWSAFIEPWSATLVIAGRREPFVSTGDFPAFPTEERGRRIAVAPNPQALAATPDGKRLLVACDSTGRGARRIALLDVASGAVEYRSIPGSSNLRGIAVEPQGKFALAVHLVPKSDLPATQIEQGWVFTNAISYVPLTADEPIVTFPLDLRTQAFANPEGVAIAPDGQRAYVTHAGADLVSVIDLRALVAITQASGGREPPEAPKKVSSHPGENAGPDPQRGRQEERERERRNQLRESPAGDPHSPTAYRADDLRLTRNYVRARIPVGANPRGIAVSPDGKWVAVANRLDDSISLIDATLNVVIRTIHLNDKTPPNDDPVRRGERLFFSGKLSFGGQFSCASCHPDGHTDGLNWDLPADGFNNFHNTKSLLAIADTAPYGWTGNSATLRDRFTGTLRHLFQHEPAEDEIAALDAYLAQLRYPDQSRPRVNPSSPAAERGRALFRGAARCTDCHSGAKLADRRRHNVGTGSDGEQTFDTPSLLRISETAPYLHDGRAETLEEIFTRHNPDGQHGAAADLSAGQLSELVEYLKGL